MQMLRNIAYEGARLVASLTNFESLIRYSFQQI